MMTKMIVIGIVIGFVPLIVLSLIMFSNTQNGLEQSTEESFDSVSIILKSQIEEKIQAILEKGAQTAGTENVRNVIRNKTTSTYQAMEEFATQMTSSEIMSIFVTNIDGRVVYSLKDKQKVEGKNFSSKEYIKSALEGHDHMTDLFYSTVSDSYVMSIGMPVYSQNKLIGSVAFIIDHSALSAIVNKGMIALGEGAEAYIVDREGHLLTATSKYETVEEELRVSSQSIDRALVALKENDSSFYYHDIYKNYDGVKVIGSASLVQFGRSEAALILEQEYQVTFASLQGMKISTLISFVIISVVSFIILLIASRSIARPLVSLSQSAKIMSEYQLNKDIERRWVSRRDEIGVLAQAIDSVQDSLRSMLRQVAATSDQVVATSEELTATSSQSATAAQEVAQTVTEIARGATEQAQNTSDGSGMLLELGEAVEHSNEEIDKIHLLNDQHLKIVDEGLQAIGQLIDYTKKSDEYSVSAYRSISKADESTAEISQAAGLIASISDQTNLLALNAAIEAARAGEAGRGFAVVAEEIRKLAEETTESAKKIDEIVWQLKSDSSEAVGNMSEAKKISDLQSEAVGLTEKHFKDISESMAHSVEGMELLTDAAEQMNERRQKVQEVLEGLSAVAEENAASTQQASASIQEQTASMHEIANASENLSEMAQQLQEMIRRFEM